MRVRFLQQIDYPDRSYKLGDIGDLPEEHAIRFLNAGMVQPAPEEKTETAMRKKSRGR